MTCRHNMRSGVTLIEIMLSLILISTVMLVSLTASANLRRQRVQQRVAVDAESLGGQILDEISSLDFRDRSTPIYGLEAGETAADRTTFDDLDDFHGYVSTPPTHRDGSNIDGYQDWSFSVAVLPAEPDATGIVTSNDAQKPLRIVSVTCTAPDGTSTIVATLVSEVPSNIPESTSFERWRRLKIQFVDRELTVTAPLRNAPDAY